MEVRAHPFFKQVDKQRVEFLLNSTEELALPAGRVIFEEGHVSDSLFLVLEGTIAFRKKLRNDDYLTVSYSSKGEYFGEIGVLTTEPRSLRAETETAARIARIPGSILVDFLRNMPGPMESLLQSVIRHLHDTTRQYIDDRLQQEKMAVVGSMTNTIIHDFKNPFCLISLSAQLLRRRHTDPESVRLCNSIEKQIERMVNMATELAEFSRGEQNLEKVKLTLKEVLDEFRSLNYPYFDHEKIEISIDVPELRFLGSKAKLIRVFQNLVGNAIDAFGEREGFIRISARPNYAKRIFQVDIEDNAGGIPEAIRPRFFEPFVSFGKREGTGLGSAIARSIVEAHDGTLKFSTETGKGTIFHMTLPLLSTR